MLRNTKNCGGIFLNGEWEGMWEEVVGVYLKVLVEVSFRVPFKWQLDTPNEMRKGDTANIFHCTTT